jgi:hypothetical protein
MPGLENNFTKKALYIAGGLILVYLMIYFLTPKPPMPIDYRASIDSLIQSNNALIDHQNKIDSIIIIYSARVDSVDNKIDSIKEKTIIIKKYYHEVSAKVDTFQVSQLDSFFNARYPQP